MVMKTYAMVMKVNHKSSNYAFTDVMEGDIYKFLYNITTAGSSNRGTHAKYIDCENLRTGRISELTFNQIPRVINCCELMEVVTLVVKEFDLWNL